MRRSAAVLAIAVLALAGGVASAGSQPQSFTGTAWVGVKGWGNVNLAKGLLEHEVIRCTRATCLPFNYLIGGPRIVLNEAPYKGWKFTGWQGACKGAKTRCVINVVRLHPNAYGQRTVHVGATFTPVAPGLTSGHPLPVGTEANIGQGLAVRVNSASANVQLTSPAPTGAEYFAANITVTYTGGGSQDPDYFGFSLKGSHNTTYTAGLNPCPYPGPQPRLDVFDPLFSGQSTSGYVCWTIAANDETSVELLFGSGTLDFPGTTWFALH
jgi:hypothetical protein